MVDQGCHYNLGALGPKGKVPTGEISIRKSISCSGGRWGEFKTDDICHESIKPGIVTSG